MLIPPNERLTGDDAKLSINDDEFGLAKIAESIAVVLTSRISANGYTIGVEAEWGAGKSSLINFVIEKMAKDNLLHKTIRFEPWLVGTKDALLASLFALLSDAIRAIGADTDISAQLASNPTILAEVRSHIARYGAALERGTRILDAGTMFDSSGKSKLAIAGLKALTALAWWLAPRDKTLEQLKQLVKDDLQTLSNLVQGLRITVIIDNLDRLDPNESVEILRLIKAVADFPLITYLVCFDRAALTAHVRKVLPFCCSGSENSGSRVS